MTPAQDSALKHPCRLACETTNPLYHRFDGEVSLVLTVNSGYE